MAKAGGNGWVEYGERMERVTAYESCVREGFTGSIRSPCGVTVTS